MALNFPSSPALGQKHPASPVAGLPTYTWDGEKWTTSSAPIEGLSYVQKSGDTMTGDLTISKVGAAFIMNATEGSGDWAWMQANKNGVARWGINFADEAPESGGDTGSNFFIASFTDAGDVKAVPFSIFRGTGEVRVADPITSTGVATKRYVDNNAASFPAGTVMLFHNNTAPIGWTRRTDWTDYTLRINNNSNMGYNPGYGLSSFVSWTGTGGAALSATYQGHMSLGGSFSGGNYASQYGELVVLRNDGNPQIGWAYNYASQAGFTQGHVYVTGSISGLAYGNDWSGAAHTHSINNNIAYLDFMMATKD